MHLTNEEANELIALAVDSVRNSKGVLRFGQALFNIGANDERFKEVFNQHVGTPLDVFYKNTEDTLNILLTKYVK